jgi:hypothetical protein
MRKLLALALLATCSLAVVPSFAGAPSFKQATSDYQAGKYQVALIEFEKFRESYPTNLQVHYYEALCYQGLNQFDKAKEEFQFVIDNDEGRLKVSAQAGLKQLNDAHISSNGYHNVGAPPNAINRAIGPGRLAFVYEFLDRNMCAKCTAFGSPCFNASIKFAGDVTFSRINVEDSDWRVPYYNPTKHHPWLVFVDGTYPKGVVLWQGITPPDANKIVAQVMRYRGSYTRPSTPGDGSYTPVDTARTQLQIAPPLSQTNPSSINTNPYAPIAP